MTNENIGINQSIYSQFVADILEAQKKNSLIFFIGAGVSISQGYPNWNKYIDQLINYWTFQLKKLTELPDTIETEVSREDFMTLNYLSTSSYSNKRKVDFVCQLISKYSKGNDGELESIGRYKKHVLDFEKLFFLEMAPVISENTILNELVKLDPLFITTNYDKEIEKSFRNIKGVHAHSFGGIHEIRDEMKLGSVIHMHGIPDGEPDYFISSSESYSKIYYKSSDELKKLRELINRKNSSTVVFVGCSMEEDEVLSLLDETNTNAKYYALMKYNNEPDRLIVQHFNEFIFNYYNEKKKVKFVWFGENYSDLTDFTKKFVAEIDRIKKGSPKDYMRRALLGE